MKLFLTSSGLAENLAPDFLKLVGKRPENIKFYFVPTATDGKEDKTWTVKSMDDFAQVGINPVWYALRFKTKETIARELADADVIWVGGGNTFYLLDVARRVGFLDVVADLVRNNGVVYAGTSAGTILTNPTIDLASWGETPDPNNVGITDLTAFGFIDALTHVHYELSENALLLAQPRSLPLYLLPDGSALRVVDSTIETIGGVIRRD